MNNPCDPAAERAVLAGIAAYGGDVYADVADLVTTKAFSIDSNQVIWRCMERIFEEHEDAKVDYPSLLSSAKSLKLDSFFGKQEEQQHLRAILNMPVRQESVRKLAGQIAKLAIARGLAAQMESSQTAIREVTGTEPIDHILGLAENPIFEFTSNLARTDQAVCRMGTGARAYLQHLADNPRQQMGISTGMKLYDVAIGGGYRPNSVDIVASRPKTGKTQLADNTGVHIAMQNIPVLNLDTEMTKEEHIIRVAANMAGVPAREIECGGFGKNSIYRDKVLAAADKLLAMPYYYRSVAGEPFEETLAHMRRWVLRDVGLDENGRAKPCVIIYDYIKLMTSEGISKNLAEYQALGFILTSLKNFAARYQVACPCFAQLNRDGIDREDTSVISGSDRLIWFCTSFSIYKWKSDEEMAAEAGESAKYTHKLIPIVSRHGERWHDGDYINVQADYKYGRITEGPTRKQLEMGEGGTRQQKGIVVSETKSQDGVDFAA